MTVYRLTRLETWALTSLALPPFTQASRLLGWLGESPPPDLEQAGPAALNTLEAKGYYHPADASQPLDPTLAKSLAILGAASLELHALIRRGDKATMALFALAGSGAAQYLTDDDSLILHPPLTLSELALQLLPSWFEVKQAENYEAELSLTAFLIFKEACLLQDIDEVLDETETGSISRSELVDYFQQAAGWVDIYHEMGMQDIPASQQLPIASALNELLQKGLLIDAGDGRLRVGQTAEPLRSALSDLGYCSITFSLETPEDPPETAVFLYGAQRLFLLSINQAQVKIGQMAGKTQARLWLGNLLARTRQMPLEALYPTDQAEFMEPTMIASPPLTFSQPLAPQSQQAVKFCTACGARLNPSARFCGECGAKVGV